MTTPSDPNDDMLVAFRAYVERHSETTAGTGSPRRSWRGWPAHVLLMDFETTTDPAQALTFGFWRLCGWTDSGTLRVVYEGIVVADDLRRRDPKAFAALRRYAASCRFEGEELRLADRLLPRAEFVPRIFWKCARRLRAVVTGFNLPFDLSRLAVAWGEGRGRWRGGFSLVLEQYRDPASRRMREDRYAPRLCIKSLDSVRSFIQLTAGRGSFVDELDESEDDASDAAWVFAGHFLDLRTLAFALTSEKYSLASAARAFKTAHEKLDTKQHGRVTRRYIDYARRDVLVTQELLEKLRAEFDRHPIALDPCKAFSPAAIAKAYLDALGVAPPTRQFTGMPRELYGIAMASYYGGRAEAHIRKLPVPVVHVDYMSMYPTINTLMGNFALLTAESIDAVEDARGVRSVLQRVTVARCFERDLWGELSFFAEVEPDGDVLPVRAQYDPGDQGFTIGINRFTHPAPFWYAGPDLVASVLLTGKVPRVRRAYRLVPRGKQATLQSVELGGAVPIDPVSGDLFKSIIEERARLKRDKRKSADERALLRHFLKILANSGAYGVFAEINREELTKDATEPVTVYGHGEPFDAETTAPENPGRFFFPPLAALITAGARLMLALLERCVRDAGGTYAFCDTDSMAIVATERGGPVPPIGTNGDTRRSSAGLRALSWAKVRSIVRRFARLNPYDPAAVPGSILEIKEVNFDAEKRLRQLYAYVISAKRYTFFVRTRNGVEVLEPSEHGLGQFVDPLPGAARKGNGQTPKWIADVWTALVRRSLGLRAQTPGYAQFPALSRINVSSPNVLRPFAAADARKPASKRVRPLNFLSSAHVAPMGHPVGADVGRFHLASQYESDPRKALALPWIDIHTGKRYRVTTASPAAPNEATLKTYGHALAMHAVHPESKSAGPDGSRCERSTIGLLQRRHVKASRYVYIGKEANKLESVRDGLEHRMSDVLSVYFDPSQDEWATVLRPQLATIANADVASALGVSQRTARAWRNGHARPSRFHMGALREFLVSEREQTQRAQRKRPKRSKTGKRRKAARARRSPTRRTERRRRGP